jgi:chorismate mutase
VADRKVPETAAVEPAELRRLRRRIDDLDRRIVRLLNERADQARAVGRGKVTNGRRAIRDAQREREILLRVSIANDGPTPQADLLAIFRRLFAVARELERRDRTRHRRAAPFGGEAGTTADEPGGDQPDVDA